MRAIVRFFLLFFGVAVAAFASASGTVASYPRSDGFRETKIEDDASDLVQVRGEDRAAFPLFRCPVGIGGRGSQGKFDLRRGKLFECWANRVAGVGMNRAEAFGSDCRLLVDIVDLLQGDGGKPSSRSVSSFGG